MSIIEKNIVKILLDSLCVCVCLSLSFFLSLSLSLFLSLSLSLSLALSLSHSFWHLPFPSLPLSLSHPPSTDPPFPCASLFDLRGPGGERREGGKGEKARGKGKRVRNCLREIHRPAPPGIPRVANTSCCDASQARILPSRSRLCWIFCCCCNRHSRSRCSRVSALLTASACSRSCPVESVEPSAASALAADAAVAGTDADAGTDAENLPHLRSRLLLCVLCGAFTRHPRRSELVTAAPRTLAST